jgi:UDP-3-O-[3-hydroxymyristoyl] glucosamine N-acyltransferase
MDFPHPIAVKDLARDLRAQLIGDDSLFATGINEIHKVRPGDITFADVAKYFKKSIESAATIIILNEPTECPEGKALLIVDDPFTAYDGLIRSFRPFHPATASISDTAEVHPSAIIEPNVVIGHKVKIGADCYIQANSYIGNFTEIGDRVTIQAGCIIGTDAFYYKKREDRYEKWCSGGRVVIEDDVEIGAACTINKGVSGDTRIGAGTKLDSQVHLGHGVEIGKNCLLAGQVGIGGKTIVEDNVVLYGQVGIIQSVRIGEGAVVLAGSGVSKSLEGGKVYFGSPAAEMKTRYRELAAMRHLPDFFKEYYGG